MDKDGKFESAAELEGLPMVEGFTDIKLEDETDEIAIAWRESPSSAIGRIRMSVFHAEQLKAMLESVLVEIAELRRVRGPRNIQ